MSSCVCGGKVEAQGFASGHWRAVQFKCLECGIAGPAEKSRQSAETEWNKMIRKLVIHEKLVEALKKICGKTCVMGYDYGDSDVYAIAMEALKDAKEHV